MSRRNVQTSLPSRTKTDSDRNAFFSKEDSGGNPFFYVPLWCARSVERVGAVLVRAHVALLEVEVEGEEERHQRDEEEERPPPRLVEVVEALHGHREEREAEE